MEYDKSKMRELILYIARAQADDPTFGRVKLAKLLYFVDNEAFVRLERPITGATYQKLPEGPAAREFVPLRDEMLLNGDAVEVPYTWPNGKVSLRLEGRDPDVSVFDASELQIVDQVLNHWRGVGASAISKASHEEIGWKVGTMNRGIPYEAYFLAPSLSDHLREVVLKAADQLGLVA